VYLIKNVIASDIHVFGSELIIFHCYVKGMDLDDKTILQVNATLITGLFIFITFTSISEVTTFFAVSISFIQILVSFTMIIPFAISASIIVRGNLTPSTERSYQYLPHSLKMLRNGILILMGGVGVIAVLRVYGILEAMEQVISG
jgi:hypothetical protein